MEDEQRPDEQGKPNEVEEKSHMDFYNIVNMSKAFRKWDEGHPTTIPDFQKWQLRSWFAMAQQLAMISTRLSEIAVGHKGLATAVGMASATLIRQDERNTVTESEYITQLMDDYGLTEKDTLSSFIQALKDEEAEGEE